MKSNIIDKIQERVANACIGNSTLRNQGAKGVAEKTRKFLKDINLNKFSKIKNSKGFNNKLNTLTSQLKNKLPKDAKNWGTARKALNVFLLEVTFNIKLSKKYKLEKIIDFLEVPLDSYVYNGLKKEFESKKIKTYLKKFPSRPGIKNLKKPVSDKLQRFALEVAKHKQKKLQEKFPRAYLDLFYWKRGKSKND